MNFYQQLQNDTQTERQYLLQSPVIKLALQGELPLDSYRAFLTEAYHHVKHTLPLLMAVGARLPADKEWMRESMVHYISEETGHQEWILSDIRATGGDAEAVRNGQPQLATELMVSYAWDTVQRNNPVGFLGMVFVLEGTSAAIATHAAQYLQQSLKLPDAAFTYLRSHGCLDLEHIDFFEKLVNRLDDARDRAAVLHVAGVMYRLYAEMFRTLPVHGL